MLAHQRATRYKLQWPDILKVRIFPVDCSTFGLGVDMLEFSLPGENAENLIFFPSVFGLVVEPGFRIVTSCELLGWWQRE